MKYSFLYNLLVSIFAFFIVGCVDSSIKIYSRKVYYINMPNIISSYTIKKYDNKNNKYVECIFDSKDWSEILYKIIMIKLYAAKIPISDDIDINWDYIILIDYKEHQLLIKL